MSADWTHSAVGLRDVFVASFESDRQHVRPFLLSDQHQCLCRQIERIVDSPVELDPEGREISTDLQTRNRAGPEQSVFGDPFRNLSLDYR